MREKSVEKMDALHEKAIELIVELGFDGFSLHKLAQATGMSAGNIYTYFENKELLLIRCYNYANFNFSTVVLRRFRPDMGLKEGLWHQWQNRYAMIRKYPIKFQFTEQFRNSPLINLHGTTNPRLRDTMLAFVKCCVEKGELADLPEEVFWALAYGPFYTLVNFNLRQSNMAGKPFTLSPALLKQTFDRVLKSLA